MRVVEEELYKVRKKFRHTFKNKVYAIGTNPCYHGDSFVYAQNVEVANELINKFKEEDTKNIQDSKGYMLVSEKDYTGEFTDEPTKIVKGIYYSG